MGTEPQQQSKLLPYSGPMNEIQTTLATSFNKVMVMVPNSTMPMDAQINISTLRSFTDPKFPGVTVYQVRDAMDTLKSYMFMADSASGKLVIKDTKPLVSPMGTEPQQQSKLVPYTGSVNEIQTTLAASFNKVTVIVANSSTPIDVQVNISTLRSFTDPKFPAAIVYKVNNAVDSLKTYMFMADSVSGKLIVKDNKPLVSQMDVAPQPQSKLVPYSGPMTTIQASLSVSLNSVKVMIPNNPAPIDVQINISSLRSFTDPKFPGVMVYKVNNAMDSLKTYLFMADSASGQLKIQENKPMVSQMDATPQTQSKLIPYSGQIAIITTALTTSFNKVRVMAANSTIPIDAQVNIATLQSFTDQKNPGVPIYQVKDAIDSTKTYIFMADSASGQLTIQDNKPVVSEMLKNQNSNLMPFHGAITTIDSILTSSNNQVQLLNQQNNSLTPISINRATLQSIPDTKEPGKNMVIAMRSDDPTKAVAFTSLANNPTNVNIDPVTNRPIVAEMQP
jgi:hypothetical protein